MKPQRARESMFSPEGGSQPPASLPWSRSPRASQPLCAPSSSAHLLHQHPGTSGEGGGRPRDPPPRPLEEPLQAPAAAPEPSPLPQLLPRKFTSRAAAGKQQPGAGHLLIGESRAALHLLPAPWKSLLLAFQGGSLLQSSRVVDKHQSHGVNQVPGGEKKKYFFFFRSPSFGTAVAGRF